MSQQAILERLSEHDRKVLDSIFNPLEESSSVAQIINPEGDANLVDIEENADSDAAKQSKQIEVEAIKLAETDGRLDEALELFRKAIEIAPKRVSAQNNCAQALRLAGKDEEALQHLNMAIDGCQNELKTKCHALCQRGVLYRKQGNLDAARRDFEAAAELGSKFAKTQLVEINPYAALCNQMLRQAFQQLQ